MRMAKHALVCSRTNCRLLPFSLLVASLFCFSPQLRAQIAVARINGTITDSSGAVIPEAQMVLANVESGVRRETSTNRTGVYSFVDIIPGQFTLEASKPGFTTQIQAVFTLNVNQTATYNFTLPVGTETQTVTVQAEGGANLQTGSAELGTVINQSQVVNLPLNGRGFTQILDLTPGASPANVGQNSTAAKTGVNLVGQFSFPSVGGQTNRSNMFLVDGINDNDQWMSTYTVAPIIDTIQEFKIESHNDQAQFGGALGGIVNVVTKSGTNRLHGDAWEFLRNTAFDARNPLLASVTPYTWNQFGSDIGGPVVIPHVYNGKNKTFFFGGYEGYRLHTASSSLYLVPTPAELSGDFSGLVNSSGKAIPIYNPFSTRTDPNNPSLLLRTPFPNNVIPSQLIDPNAQKLAAAIYPAPINTGVANTNGVNLYPSYLNYDEYHLRIDEQLGTKDFLWWRMIHTTSPSVTPLPFQSGTLADNNRAYNWGANWTHTFGPTTVIEVQFGRNYGFTSAFQNYPESIAKNLMNLGGYSSTFDCGFIYTPRSCYVPAVTITGYAGWGENTKSTLESDLYEWKVNLSKTVGRHSFTMGADFNWNGFARPVGDSVVTYGSTQTSNLQTSSGGDAFASYLLGVPVSANYANRNETEHGAWEDGFYFQDQWRPIDRLTLNIGVRYDLPLFPIFGDGPGDPNSHIGDMDFNNGTYILAYPTPSCANTNNVAPCIPGGTLPAHVVLGPSNGRIIDSSLDNIQPRFGFAYRITKNNVIRGSYTRQFDDWAAVQQMGQNLGGGWPTVGLLQVSNLNPGLPSVTSQNPLSTASTAPSATPFSQVESYINPHIRNPYAWQWNFGIQHAFGVKTTLTLDYAGATDLRLDEGIYANTAPIPGPGCTGPPNCSRLPYPYIVPTTYDNSIGKGHYHALQFSLRKSTSNLTYIVNYTWSKMIDQGTDGWFGSEGASIENPYNLKNDKSVAGFDLTHIFSGSWVYKLPFGPGQHFQTGHRVLDYVLGPWQLNGIVLLSSGIPYTLTAQAQILNTGNIWERPNYTGQPLGIAKPSPAAWFNTAAYAAPPAYTFGNVGRNTARADWMRNLDLSFFRTFPIAESKSLEFRAEAFNVGNLTVWGTPDVGVSDRAFGAITNTRNTARQIQLALKLTF